MNVLPFYLISVEYIYVQLNSLSNNNLMDHFKGENIAMRTEQLYSFDI